MFKSSNLEVSLNFSCGSRTERFNTSNIKSRPLILTTYTLSKIHINVIRPSPAVFQVEFFINYESILNVNNVHSRRTALELGYSQVFVLCLNFLFKISWACGKIHLICICYSVNWLPIFLVLPCCLRLTRWVSLIYVAQWWANDSGEVPSGVSGGCREAVNLGQGLSSNPECI